MAEIPRRVSLQPNGTYIWSAELDMESERKNYRTGGRICITAALVFFVAGIIISLFYHNWHPFLYLTVFSIITALITIGVVHVNKVPVIIPSKAELSAFDSIAQPIFAQIRNLRAENDRLAAIRDTLLPRLMSGELDVSDIEL